MGRGRKRNRLTKSPQCFYQQALCMQMRFACSVANTKLSKQIGSVAVSMHGCTHHAAIMIIMVRLTTTNQGLHNPIWLFSVTSTEKQLQFHYYTENRCMYISITPSLRHICKFQLVHHPTNFNFLLSWLITVLVLPQPVTLWLPKT